MRHALAGGVRIKRVYEPRAADDGLRVLVDRLWPRGLTREAAALDYWLKDCAPSPALRTWFGHEPARFAAFSARYDEELDANPAALAELRAVLARGAVTLLYAARDPHCNHALVLAAYLAAHPSDAQPGSG